MLATIGNSLLTKLKPKDKPYEVRDEKLKGFLIRVNISGKMLYMCEYARGKRITIGKVGVLTPMQARDLAKEALANFTKGIDPKEIKKTNNSSPSKKLTLTNFIQTEYATWVETHRKRGKETIARLKANFLDEFGSLALNELTPLQIEKWRTARLKDGIKAATANRDIITLKAAISKAVEWNFIDTHPLIKLKLLKLDDPSRIRFLNEDEESRLRETLKCYGQKLIDSRERANKWRRNRNYPEFPDLKSVTFAHHIQPLTLLAMNTGLRRGELFNLRWKHINFEQAVLTVIGDNTKNTKTRHIPLNQEALEVLISWYKQTVNSEDIDLAYEKNQLIFPGENGKPLTSLKRVWCNITKTAKLDDFHFHDLRHHFASRLVMAGVDLNTVRELLGHADIKMTLRYAHLAPQHKANAVAKLVRKDTLAASAI